MKKMVSIIVALTLILALSAGGFLVSGAQTYDAGDVAAIKKIITDNALDYDVDDPSTWDFALWWGGRVYSLGLNNKGLKTLDVSALTNLQNLYCSINELTTLDVTALKELQRLECGENKLTELKLDNPKLDIFSCTKNNLETIDLTKNEKMSWIDVGGNKLTTIDLSKNTAVTTLGLGSNKFDSIDLSKNVILKSLTCNDNNLTEIDLSKNPDIDKIFAQNNKIEKFSVEGFTKLISVSLSGNPLTEFTNIKGGKLVVKDTVGGSVDLNFFIHDSNTYSFTATPDENCTFLTWKISKDVTFNADNSLTTKKTSFSLVLDGGDVEISALFSQMPTVEKAEFSDITTTGASVSAKYNLNGGTLVEASKSARYRAVGTADWTVKTTDITYKDGVASFKIDGLKLGTKYEVQVFVENENGGVWSAVSQFTTQDKNPGAGEKSYIPAIVLLSLACAAVFLSRKNKISVI